MKSIKIKNTVTVFAMASLLLLITGISFAAYNYISNASDNNITSGQITMSYTEPSNTVVLKDALPQPDDLGMVQDEYFEFSVMSNATTNENDDKGVEIPYEVSIQKVAVDASLKQLEDKDIKVYLTKLEGANETKVLGPTLISDLDKSAYKDDSLAIYDQTNTHKNNNGPITTKFRLRFWIDNLVDVSNWATTNEYEYRFKVNVNANSEYLDVENMNTLSSKIKNAYTVENGTAVEKDGYYYLQGAETSENNQATGITTMISQTTGIYVYREEVKAANVQPTSNIRTVTDTKEYTYNQEQLEVDIKSYFLSTGTVTAEEYEEIMGPYGGYINGVLGTIAGVVDFNNGGYIGDNDITDIPSLDTIMSDESTKAAFMEMMNDIIPEIISKDTMIAIYSDGNKFNEQLLNDNIAFALIESGSEDIISVVNANFGSLSNYIIAVSEGMTNDDKLQEQYTIEDIPTLESIFLSNIGNVLLKNTYVELNGIIWEVMGINEDNTIKLMATSNLEFPTAGTFLEGNVGKFLGLSDYKYSSFMALIKNTTLKDLIVKAEYEYNDEGVDGKILSYAGMPTYNEIKNSIIGGFSYLIPLGDDNNYVSVSKGETISGYNYSTKYYNCFYNNTYNNQIAKEDTRSTVYLYPVITIKNIEVVGEGTKENPYKIAEEITQTEKGIAQSIAYSFIYSPATNYNLYENILGNNKLSMNKSGTYSHNNVIYSAGISIDNKCYYETRDETSTVIDYSGNCSDHFLTITKEPETTINAYVFNEMVLAVEGTNITSYQWQQKVGDEWTNLEDLTGRISGAKTSTLSVIPTKDYSATNYYRCKVSNEVSMAITNEITVNIGLSDGEFVYEEIEDTNKYQIISYIGDYTNSSHFSLMEDGTNYHLKVPSIINGDEIVNIKSVYEKTNIGNSTWYSSTQKMKSIEFESGIKKIEGNLCPSSGSTSYVEKIKFNEDLEIIGESVFNNSRYLKELEIPGSVKSIGRTAFYASPLEKLSLHEGLETIGVRAFNATKLTTLEIPSTVKTIENYAFPSSKLTTLTLHEGLETIGTSAFNQAILIELEIPGSVKSIGSSSFNNSPLTSLTFEKEGQLETIENYAFVSAKLTELELPNTLKTIGDYAFKNSALTTLNIPENVTYVGEHAFSYSELVNLSLSKNLKIIGNGSFKNAHLTNLIIPDTVTEIGMDAFYESKLTSLSIPDNVAIIDNSAFYESELTNLKLSKNLTYIGSWAFFSAKLTNIEIPSGVTYIGKSAFCSSILTSLKLPNNLEEIGDYAFNDSLITSLEIPASVKTIGGAAFYKSPLTTLILHEGLETIDSVCTGQGGITSCKDQGAFYSARLDTLSIPASIKTIGINNFYYSKFKNLKIYGKTSLTEFMGLGWTGINIEDGYEIQYIPGTLE